MSEQQPEEATTKPGDLKETERIVRGGHGPGAGMVGQKADDFWSSGRRVAGLLRPQRVRTLLVLALTVVSVALTSVGPRILGHATDLVFRGLIGARLPEGMSKGEAVRWLRERGDAEVADMVAAMEVVPGQGVDFLSLIHI